MAEVSQLSQSIPKNLGMLFLFAAALFLLTAILFFLKYNLWFVFAFVGVITSQILIIMYWQDAKFGTIANGIILFATILAFTSWNFKNRYENDVNTAFAKAALSRVEVATTMITQEELEKLPIPVQKYLIYVGVLGQPKLDNFRVTFDGEMRGKEQDWFPFTSEQYNFFEYPTRLFFMNARVKGLPTAGYHRYQDTVASMHIKPLSLFSVVNNNAPELFTAETVTFFNDLCLFAPAALIDDSIKWELINDTSVKAYFSNQGTTISATLYFNEKGQLINFVSDDRYVIDDMKKYRFSTPVKNYKNINGYNLPSYGEAIWHYPEGKFVYGKFHLKQIEYNTTQLKD